MTTPTTIDMLTELPDLAAACIARLTTQTPGDTTSHTRHTTTPTAPLNLTILHLLDPRIRTTSDDAQAMRAADTWQCPHHTHPPRHCPHGTDPDGRQGILGQLATWARHIHTDLDLTSHTPDPLPDTWTWHTTTHWLATHLDAWHTHTPHYPAMTDLDHDIHTWWTRLHRELGDTPPPQLRHTTGCGGPLATTTTGDYECRDCHETFTLPQLLAIARWHAPVTLAEAATITGIPLGTLKQRAKRGRLTPIDPTQTPRHYYLRDITPRKNQHHHPVP